MRQVRRCLYRLRERRLGAVCHDRLAWSIVQRKLALSVISSCPECHWYEPCGGYRDHNGLFANTWACIRV